MVPINALSKGEEVLKTMHLPLLEHSRLKSRDYESWYDTREQVLRQYNESEDFKFLSCKVVPKQPLLRLNPSSSAAADASLYEGEA